LWSGSERRDSGTADDDVTLADRANRQRLPPNARVTARFDISPFPSIASSGRSLSQHNRRSPTQNPANRPQRSEPMHYLDANATQPLRPAARDAITAAFAVTGNPSSVHRAGQAVRRILEDAREAIASGFGGQPADLVFTSGGTEADALAIHALSG
jgi:selenocysteine lyase/cysteine desulfurase